MNWGGFGSGFSSGFAGGVYMGNTFKKAKDEATLGQLREQGLAEAATARNIAADGLIQPEAQQLAGPGVENQPVASAPAKAPEGEAMQLAGPGADESAVRAAGVPAATEGLTFSVGDKRFASRDEARGAAEKQVPDIMDFYAKNIGREQEALIKMGRTDEADKLGTWAESRRAKQAMKLHADAMTKLLFTNDIDGGVKALGQYYNDFVDDGVQFGGYEIGKDGQINITLKGGKDGAEEGKLSLSKNDIVRLGAAYDPVAMQKMMFDQVAQQAKTEAEIAKEKRKLQGEIVIEGVKAGNRATEKAADHQRELDKIDYRAAVEASSASAKEKRAITAKIDTLKTAGYSDDFINGILPGLLGVGDYKKATSPEEARRLAHSDRMKNDPRYSRMPPEQQSKVLDQDMAIIFAGGKPSNTSKPASPKPAAAPPQAAGGLPVYDTKTGKVVYR